MRNTDNLGTVILSVAPMTTPLDVVELRYEQDDHDEPVRYLPVRVPIVGIARTRTRSWIHEWEEVPGTGMSRRTNRRFLDNTYGVEYLVHDEGMIAPRLFDDYDESLTSAYVVGIFPPGEWPSMEELEGARDEVDIKVKRHRELIAQRRAEQAVIDRGGAA